MISPSGSASTVPRNRRCAAMAPHSALSGRRFRRRPVHRQPGGGVPARLPGCPMTSCRRSRPRTICRRPRFSCRRATGYRLRWFTPTTEVDLCGHATLASAFVVFGWLAPWRRSVTFQTEKAGPLDGARATANFWRSISRPARRSPATTSEALAAALGKRPTAALAARDYLAVFDSAEDVAALDAGFRGGRRIGPVRGDRHGAGGGRHRLCLALFCAGARRRRGPGDRLGALHADPLLGRAARQDRLEARQLSRRGGALSCALRGDRVTIAGRATLYLTGTIAL